MSDTPHDRPDAVSDSAVARHSHASMGVHWLRASTLLERQAAGQGDIRTSHASLTPRGSQRLQAWAAQPPFDSADWFERRLTIDRLTRAELGKLLAESDDDLQRRFTAAPAWLSDVACALSTHSVDEPLPMPARLKRRREHGFLHVAAPFIHRAIADVNARSAALATTRPCPFDPDTVGTVFVEGLARSLLDIVTRTLVLDLNIARLKGELRGETPEQRFDGFVERLRRPGRVQELLSGYPVLARLLLQECSRWVTATGTFLQRLSTDWTDLRTWPSVGGDPGVLSAVKSRLADSHRGGHSVVIATFQSGARLVYKAKSLKADAQFQRLLDWLNARGQVPAFPVMQVLDRGTHGWVTHVAAYDCATPDEVHRFYRRQGGYLAVLHALDATDFHAGNVIAAGEHPFLIDLEGLFQPRRSRAAPDAALNAGRLAHRAISHSVLRSGLLPERVWGRDDVDGVDRSGLGTLDGQMTPHELPHWEAVGTDAMHLVRTRKPLPSSDNRPRLAGSAVSVIDHRDAIVTGFRHTYALLLEHRDALLAPDGPISWFSDAEVSVFLRSSRTYRRLLHESYHPDLLRDALDRDRHFDRLWVEIEDDEDLLRVLAAERDDLQQGDIPLFTSRPDSRDLWTSRGDRLADFFPEPSTNIVRRRLALLGAVDCARQSWLIEASLTSLLDDGWRSDSYSLPAVTAASGAGEWLAAATRVGDRLEALAVRGSGDAAWIGLTRQPGRAWAIEPLATDLHSGLPGVVLFLAYLGAVTGQDRHTALARAALQECRRQLAADHDLPTTPGALTGWGGIVYALAHLSALWQDPALGDDLSASVSRLDERIDAAPLPVSDGVAGCIAALRAADGLTPDTDVRRLATRCGDRILDQWRQGGYGSGLPVAGACLPGPGFAHGLPGILCALRVLDHWTGERRFGAAVRAAMFHESSAAALDATRGGGWSWVAALEHGGVPEARHEVISAMACARETGFGRDRSLGHGDCGTLAFLQGAATALDDATWTARLQLAASAVLASIGRDGWRCGVPFGIETPGLMTGLAGIGFQCLRLAAPDRVPCVVTLEPPARTGAPGIARPAERAAS